MIQRRQHFRFALETGKPFGIVRERFGQNFYGHVAPELSVVCLIHLAHSARTDLHHDIVRAEACASRDGHFFNPAAQLIATVIGEVPARFTSAGMRKRPSLLTSNDVSATSTIRVSKRGFGTSASKFAPVSLTLAAIIF